METNRQVHKRVRPSENLRYTYLFYGERVYRQIVESQITIKTIMFNAYKAKKTEFTAHMFELI